MSDCGNPAPSEPERVTTGEAVLLPCPFCGDKAVLVCDDMSDRMSQWDYRVYCQEDSCGGAGPTLRDEAGAIAAWNRRARVTTEAPAVQTEEADALRALGRLVERATANVGKYDDMTLRAISADVQAVRAALAARPAPRVEPER